MRAFDLVGMIHGREYSDHGEYVTADDYYHLMLHGEAVARLKLGLEIDLEKLMAENESLQTIVDRQKCLIESLRAELRESYAVDAAISSPENHS